MEIVSNKQEHQAENATANDGVYRNAFSDYKSLFNSLGITVEVIASHVIVGEFSNHSQWLLYISVAKSQMSNAIAAITPLILSGDLNVSIPENSQIHGMVLDGSFGFSRIGKVITISAKDNGTLSAVAKSLLHVTPGFKGPKIASAFKIVSGLYTEFAVPEFTPLETIQFNKPQESWPYDFIAPVHLKRRSRWLDKKYLITHTLKDDAKGGVYKGLNFRNWLNIKWCVIKEGKENQCVDDYGRSAIDRIEWQMQIQKRLTGLKIMPAVIDSFAEDGNAYLVMEYIDGTPYNDRVSEIQQGINYRSLGSQQKNQLIKLLQQLIAVVEAFHDQGILHRDISPINFLIRHSSELVAIDVELAYDLKNKLPSPWYTLGSEGYMSPNQRNLKKPEIADDIYGIGGIIIRTITGISPMKFEGLSFSEHLARNLSFFIDDQRLINTIVSCRAAVATDRPTISSIKHNLELHMVRLLTNRAYDMSELWNSPSEVDDLVNKSIIGLGQDPVIGPNDLWYTKTNDDDIQSKIFSYQTDLFSGATGVLYTLSVIEYSGFDITSVGRHFETNLEKVLIQTKVEIQQKLTRPGFLSGGAGIALCIAQLIRDGNIERSIANVDIIASLLIPHSGDDLSLFSGLAGYGIATMQASDLLLINNLEVDLIDVVNEILRRQTKNGYWLSKVAHRKEKLVINGLIHGVAGIAYFLLVYGQKYDHSRAKEGAQKAIDYLASQIRSQTSLTYIPISTGKKMPDPWLEHGFSGMAYLFMKAFEFSSEQRYKEIAYKLLLNHPENITSNYLSHANGITGVGEIYLEAMQIFKDIQWKERAHKIGLLLEHSCCSVIADGTYWLEGNDNIPTPDFKNGNAGVLHFLARLARPDQIKFPFININL